jgi:hypothetical protein
MDYAIFGNEVLLSDAWWYNTSAGREGTAAQFNRTSKGDIPLHIVWSRYRVRCTVKETTLRNYTKSRVACLDRNFSIIWTKFLFAFYSEMYGHCENFQ